MSKAALTLTRPRVSRIWLKTLTFVTCLLLEGTAQAQQMCGPKDALLAAFKAQFEEVPVAAGLTGERVVQVIASPAGTWSLFAISPNGVACLVLTGTEWRQGSTGRGA